MCMQYDIKWYIAYERMNKHLSLLNIQERPLPVHLFPIRTLLSLFFRVCVLSCHHDEIINVSVNHNDRWKKCEKFLHSVYNWHSIHRWIEDTFLITFHSTTSCRKSMLRDMYTQNSENETNSFDFVRLRVFLAKLPQLQMHIVFERNCFATNKAYIWNRRLLLY